MVEIEEKIANKIKENEDGLLMKFLGAENVEFCQEEYQTQDRKNVIQESYDQTGIGRIGLKFPF